MFWRTIPFLCLLGATAATAQTAPRKFNLREALEAAEKANPEVLAARLRVLETEARSLEARAALGPQLSVEVGGGYQTNNLQGVGLIFPGFPSRVGPYRTFNARPVLTQSVLNFSLWSSVKAARRRIAQSQAEAETLRDRTLLALLELYIGAQQAASRIAATEARIELARAALKQVMERVDAGTANKLDLARAQEQLEREQATLAFARRDRDTLSIALARTAGFAPDGPVELEPLPPALPVAGAEDTVALTREAQARRAERRAIVARGVVLREEEKSAQRERLPKLSFIGDYGLLGQGPDQSLSTYQVGATLSIPLWTSGRIENQVRAARQRLAQQQQELRHFDNQLAQEIQQAIVERDAAAAAAAASLRAAAAAREAVELSRLRYEAGLSTNLEVVSAQSELAQREEEAIRARHDGLLARARLAYARGDVFLFFGM